MNIQFKRNTARLSLISAIAIGFSLFGSVFFIKNAEAASLVVTQVSAVQTSATADGTYANGWKWTFNVTVPSNEPILQMKFADWVGTLGNIPAGGNMRFYSTQSLNAFDEAHAITITTTSVYSDSMYLLPNSNPNSGFDSSSDGKNIQITLEVKVPTGSAGGSYGTSYGIQTNVDTVAPVIALNGANPQTIERGTSYVELGATATDNVDGTISVIPSTVPIVDTNTIGAYTVTYLAVDSAGNTALLNRTVNVVLATQTAHLIITSAGSNGSISPNGNVIVIDGDSKSFSLVPDNGFKVDDVLVDGISVGAVNYYDFANITSNHTISVTFTSVESPTTEKTLYISLSDTVLPPAIFMAGQNNIMFAMKFTAQNGDATINGFQIQAKSNDTNTQSKISNLKVYDGDTYIADAGTPIVVAGSNGQSIVYPFNFTSTISSDSPKTYTIKGNITNYTSGWLQFSLNGVYNNSSDINFPGSNWITGNIISIQPNY
jgi:hypothetical protein